MPKVSLQSHEMCSSVGTLYFTKMHLYLPQISLCELTLRAPFMLSVSICILQMMSLLEGSLDKFTSILFIFILLIGSTLFTVFFAVQVGMPTHPFLFLNMSLNFVVV